MKKSQSFFTQDKPASFRYYKPDRKVLGKKMADHLRFAVCYWHSFVWPGLDPFGGDTFQRPWHAAGGDAMKQAEHKADVAFELFRLTQAPFFTFHDRDIAPEGATLRESNRNVRKIGEVFEKKMRKSGMKLLWGTANLFSHRRYMSGAATNPDPEVFAYAAAQVKSVLELTHELGGANYVLWGGREGYETLLNTDLAREEGQLARFLHLVAEHKHKIGFEGTLLIEPKPHEPTKHQYDFDAATVHGFLARNGLDGEYRLNIEANHATLSGHSFHHEVAYAISHGILGSIDANRGDYQNGWDTDQFPNSVEELALSVYEIVKAGGLGSGGFNFDAKLRRQSVSRSDLFHAHVGGIDTLAQSLLVAADMIERETLSGPRTARYAGWDQALGRAITAGEVSLEDLEHEVAKGDIDPKPTSGGQERLESLVNRRIWNADRKR